MVRFFKRVSSQAVVEIGIKTVNMVTLKDIAQKTGFSLSVVSRAMNPRPDQKVAEKTRIVIEAACRELGYQPNQAASLLARGSNASIGLFLPRAYGEMVGQLMTGLADIANHHGFAYNAYFGNNDEDYLEFIRYSHRIQSAGIITYLPNYLNSNLPELLTQLSGRGCQIVLLNCAGLKLAGVQTVCIDNYFGGREAARRLLETGCRRFLSTRTDPQTSWQLQERLRGFVDQLALHGITAEVPVIHRQDDYRIADADFLREIAALARSRVPAGIFMPTDYEAISLYDTLARENLLDRIGDSLRIIGFDDLIVSNLIYPALTTLRQPFQALGEISMARLLNAMVKADLPVDLNRLKPQLVIRASA
ncbi:HTH-type transcriptional regulator GalR [bioreactor metagenome]|uniref:HTH-type transcriptional regulator GalR n=1 Tax=bioreactor metagenome TaxID=1076179 RepID=A0A644ZB80_9ZZZZ